jgi:spore coat polysaccharide biosynthesis predicted glycosyltransferase SpsG
MTKRFDFALACGPDVGMGHLSRALTLAKALWARQASIRLFLSDPVSALKGLPFPVIPLADTPPSGADMLVVDGLRLPADQIEALAAASRAFAFVDDLGKTPIACDVLINQNIYGDRLKYDGYNVALRLLGPRFALVRPAFATARSGVMRTEPRVLVTFGGGLTGRTGLDIACKLALGFAGPIDVTLGAAVADPDRPLPRTVTIVRGGDMPALMARSTLYVGSLGVTFLEALTAGLPAIVAPVAADQHLALAAARALGVAAFDSPEPEAMADAAVRWLHNPVPFTVDQPDGQGAERVADALVGYLSGRA